MSSADLYHWSNKSKDWFQSPIKPIPSSTKTRKTNPKMIIILLIIMVPVAKCNEIAYDCASADDVISTFSLTDMAECSAFRQSYSNATSETIQVLQKTSNTQAEAQTCKVVLNRRVCRCEFFTSSQLGSQPSMIDFQLPGTKEQC